MRPRCMSVHLQQRLLSSWLTMDTTPLVESKQSAVQRQYSFPAPASSENGDVGDFEADALLARCKAFRYVCLTSIAGVP